MAYLIAGKLNLVYPRKIARNLSGSWFPGSAFLHEPQIIELEKVLWAPPDASGRESF
jgi:hypothetical protein